MATPLKSLSVPKDTKFVSQEKNLHNYLFIHSATIAMASEAIGIKEKKLTRIKRHLEKVGKLKCVFKAKCQVSRHQVSYLTTNPDRFPFDPQGSLFDSLGGLGYAA